MKGKKRKKHLKKQYRCRICKKRFVSVKIRNKHEKIYCKKKTQLKDPDYLDILDSSEDKYSEELYEK